MKTVVRVFTWTNIFFRVITQISFGEVKMKKVVRVFTRTKPYYHQIYLTTYFFDVTSAYDVNRYNLKLKVIKSMRSCMLKRQYFTIQVITRTPDFRPRNYPDDHPGNYRDFPD